MKRKPGRTPSGGFICPECKVALRVRSTKPKQDGTVKRYRYCPRCPYFVDTAEEAVSVNGKEVK